MLQTTGLKCFSKTLKNKSFQLQHFSEKRNSYNLKNPFHLSPSTQKRWGSYKAATRYDIDKQKIGAIYAEATGNSNLGLPEDFLANNERPFDPEDEILERKKACLFCVEPEASIDAMNVPMMVSFMTAAGRIMARKYTGVCATHQRRLSHTIKKARHFGIFSYKNADFQINHLFREDNLPLDELDEENEKENDAYIETEDEDDAESFDSEENAGEVDINQMDPDLWFKALESENVKRFNPGEKELEEFNLSLEPSEEDFSSEVISDEGPQTLEEYNAMMLKLTPEQMKEQVDAIFEDDLGDLLNVKAAAKLKEKAHRAIEQYYENHKRK